MKQNLWFNPVSLPDNAATAHHAGRRSHPFVDVDAVAGVAGGDDDVVIGGHGDDAGDGPVVLPLSTLPPAAPPDTAPRKGLGALHILLLFALPCLGWWLVNRIPASTPMPAPVVVRFFLMLWFQVFALRVTWQVLRGRNLKQMQGALRAWIGVGFFVAGLGRPQTIVIVLLLAVPVILMTALAARYEGSLRDDALRCAFRATYVITIWSLVLMLCISPVQFAGQFLPFLLGWFLLMQPAAKVLLQDVYRAFERRFNAGPMAGRIIGFLWASAFILLFVNLVLKKLSGDNAVNISIAGVSVQPSVCVFYLAVWAIALRLARTGRLTWSDWTGYAAMNFGFLLLGEMGTPGLCFLSLLGLLFLINGVKAPDFRRLAACGLVAVIALLVISHLPPPDSANHGLIAGAQRRLDHVQKRVAHFEGDRPLEELVRVDLAVSTPGVLGLGGWARVWILSKAASKDFAVAAFLLCFGWLGFVQLLILYGVLFNALIAFCLRAGAGAPVRFGALSVLLASIVQALVPLAAHSGLLISVGVPLLGIARGGTQLITFIAGLLVFIAMERQGTRIGQPVPPTSNTIPDTISVLP